MIGWFLDVDGTYNSELVREFVPPHGRLTLARRVSRLLFLPLVLYALGFAELRKCQCAGADRLSARGARPCPPTLPSALRVNLRRRQEALGGVFIARH